MNALNIPGPVLADFEAAAKTLNGVVHYTPMQSAKFLSKQANGIFFLKCENLQRTGSYKVRGAYNFMSKLTPEERRRGVVAASAGNHAQGVALAAEQLGVMATIFMPIGVALPKLQATKNYGAEVVLAGHNVEESLQAAMDFAQQSGAIFVPPFDHNDIIAGQGTVGLEILEQVPDVETIIVPIGGGGLISGIASAVKQKLAGTGRTVRIIGVQAENAAPYLKSLELGKPITIETSPTIADGIAVAKPGLLNFKIIQNTVDQIVTVSDDEIATGLLLLLERSKLLAEPAGAVPVAALNSPDLGDLGKTVLVISGGNIDPLMLERVVSRGLAASERYLKMRIPLPDRPGQLARTAEIVAAANANVVEVLHTRHNSGLQISQVELELHVETRGPEHADAVLEKLREAGYEPRVVGA
ncbi:MAG: threonine ammonia-lyase [Microbacteriaceae bacterium]